MPVPLFFSTLLEPLAPGRYISYFEGTIHNAGTVFAATHGKESAYVLFFQVTSDPNCVDYSSCLKSGYDATRSAQWDESLPYLEKASLLEPSKPDPWAEIGRVYLALGQYGETAAMWDRALRLGGTLSFDVMHRKGFSSERGTLRISLSEISFLGPGQEKVFSVAPRDVSFHDRGSGSAFSPASLFMLRIEGRNYRFYPVPVGFVCKNPALCGEPGLSEQIAVATYINETISKLPSGAFESISNLREF
jgi:hypothetical protein